MIGVCNSSSPSVKITITIPLKVSRAIIRLAMTRCEGTIGIIIALVLIFGVMFYFANLGDTGEHIAYSQAQDCKSLSLEYSVPCKNLYLYGTMNKRKKLALFCNC